MNDYDDTYSRLQRERSNNYVRYYCTYQWKAGEGGGGEAGHGVGI